ncbi:MAG: hypothetical protein Q9199_005083 [Rusavskia elegans]
MENLPYAVTTDRQLEQKPDPQTLNNHASANASGGSSTTNSVSTRGQWRRTFTRSHAAFNKISRGRHASAKGIDGRRHLAPITARIDSSRRKGLISKSMAKEARCVQENCLAAKSVRVQKLQDQRVLLMSKAKEDAKIKALGRAIEDFRLDAKITRTPAEQLPSLSLILSLAYAMIFITNPDHAKQVYDHLPASLADPSYIESLSNKHRRGVRLLLRKEDELRSLIMKAGSIEAALVFQDERIAFVERRRALRDEFLLADEGVRDLVDEEHALPDETSETSPDLNDTSTAEDLIASEHNPKLRLTRKRRNRVESAKKAGRSDICAMEVESRLQKADELNQSEVERAARTDALELSPGAADYKFFEADMNPRIIKRHCHSHSHRQGQDTRVKGELLADEGTRSTPRKRPQRDTYRPIYRRSNKIEEPKKERRHVQARGVAPSEEQSYRSAYDSPTEHPVIAHQPPTYGPPYNPPQGLQSFGTPFPPYGTQYGPASRPHSYVPSYGLPHQQPSYGPPYNPPQGVPYFGYQCPPNGTQYHPAYQFMGSPWP